MRKFAKSEVGFEHPATGMQNCGGCKHFRPRDQACAIVAGRVLAEDWCRMFSAKRQNPSGPVTAYGVVTGFDAHRRKWQQESYESKSGHARIRAAQLRKLGFKVSVASLGSQVTPVGLVRMTMVTISNVDPDKAIPAPDRVERMNRAVNPKNRPPLSDREYAKLWAKYAPYFKYLGSKSAPGGGKVRRNALVKVERRGTYQGVRQYGITGQSEITPSYATAKKWADLENAARRRNAGVSITAPRRYARYLAGHLAKEHPATRGHIRVTNRLRRANFGEGRQFKFHGAFNEKAAATAKEQSIPGAFIKTMWFKSGPRYVVVTKNPAPKVVSYTLRAGTGRLVRKATRVIFPDGSRVSFTERMPKGKAIAQALALKAKGYTENPRRKKNQPRSAAVARKRVALKRKLRAAGYSFDPDLSSRELIALVTKAKSEGKWIAKNSVVWGRRNARKLCNAKIPGSGRCSRIKFHNGPHLPQGATLRPKSRLPKKWGGKKKNQFGGRLPQTGTVVDSIRAGDRVTILTPHGQQRSGRAVMPSGDGRGWVLNLGGAHGTPGIANADNIVRVSKRKNTTTWGKSGVDPQRDTAALKKAVQQLFPGKQIIDLTRAELSAASKLAWEMLHGGKKNPVQVAGGWRAVVRGRVVGPVLPSRRDAQSYAESFRNPPPGRRRNYIDEKIDFGTRRIVIWSNTPAGPYHVLPMVNGPDYQVTREVGKGYKTLETARKKAAEYARKAGWAANPRRRNYADSTELYKKFHGRGPDGVKEIQVPEAVDYGSHPELGQLGRLVSLTIGDKDAEKPWTKKIEWKNGEAPDLAAEPGGKQLYIIGGVQDLTDSLDSLPVEPDKDMLDLGFGYRIEYFTQKGFDNFQPVTYYHDLGEETGDIPRVVYDQVNKRIHIVGGAYDVKPEGIVN